MQRKLPGEVWGRRSDRELLRIRDLVSAAFDREDPDNVGLWWRGVYNRKRYSMSPLERSRLRGLLLRRWREDNIRYMCGKEEIWV